MSCNRCDDRGHVCIDDMCRGSGECIHGDSVCPKCHGDPDHEFYDDDSDDEPGEDEHEA